MILNECDMSWKKTQPIPACSFFPGEEWFVVVFKVLTLSCVYNYSKPLSQAEQKMLTSDSL